MRAELVDNRACFEDVAAAAAAAVVPGSGPARERMALAMETAMLDALVHEARRHGWKPPR